MIRRVVFSRASRTSWSRAENCQATAAAEDTSMTESRPKPISAVEEAMVPAVIATTASIDVVGDRRGDQQPYPAGQRVRGGRRDGPSGYGGHQQQPFVSASAQVRSASTATTAVRRSFSACPSRASASS